MPEIFDPFEFLPPPPLPGAWLEWIAARGVEPWIVVLFVLSFGPLVASAIIGYLQAAFHWMSINRREKRYRHLKITTLSRDGDGAGGALVAGSMVISPGAFRRFLVAIRLLIGGRVGAYHSLLARARREAILRMKRQAFDGGALEIRGVRFHTATIIGGDRSIMRAIEVTAFGSAVNAAAK